VFVARRFSTALMLIDATSLLGRSARGNVPFLPDNGLFSALIAAIKPETPMRVMALRMSFVFLALSNLSPSAQ